MRRSVAPASNLLRSRHCPNVPRVAQHPIVLGNRCSSQNACLQVSGNMRRRRSDELPRYLNDERTPFLRFHWRRRYALYLAGFFTICWLLYPTRTSSSQDAESHVNWSHYAYSLYATDSATLCHAVLLAEALDRLGSRADRVLFYPEYWDTIVSDTKDRDSQLLVLARDTYKVKLQPIKLLSVEGRTKGTHSVLHAGDPPFKAVKYETTCKVKSNVATDEYSGTWDKSVTKLLAFSLQYYERVIALDSDMTLLQHIDELFLLPKTPIAMPRAYWVESKPWPLTSMLMVIQPNLVELETFKWRMTMGGNTMLVDAHKFDMELINERFEDSAMVLPHRPYALLSSEFRRNEHDVYLGDPKEKWDAEKVFQEAKLVHFSDWPLPKPWVMWSTQAVEETQPDCGGSHQGSCAERRIWKHLYDDFRHRRRDICKLLSVPAPDWISLKNGQLGNATASTEHAAPHVEDTGA